MKYSRVRDIELGRRAPVKLSELLVICDVCGVSPVDATRRILDEAARIEDKWKIKQQLSKSLTSASTLTHDDMSAGGDTSAGVNTYAPVKKTDTMPQTLTSDNKTAHANTLTHDDKTNTMSESPTPDDNSVIADRIAAHPEEYAIAANRDPNKEIEREGGDGR